MFYWHAATDSLEKVYNPESSDDWNGLLWNGGSTTVPSGVPTCGWQNEYCAEDSASNNDVVITGR